MDVVIPFRLSPYTKSCELKYALRSIAAHLSNVGRVWIIGDMPPPGLQGYSYIAAEETNWYEYLTRNIHQKLLAACDHEAVSEDFLYMNDDHFLLDNFDADTFPLAHSGKKWGGTGKYAITVQNTHDLFARGILYNYDCHMPMRINKKHYAHTVGRLDWSKPFGYAIKTAYCYLTAFAASAQYQEDLKINGAYSIESLRSLIHGRQVFSIGDKAFKGGMLQLLEELYPNKSKYEI